jgi:glycerate kinase
MTMNILICPDKFKECLNAGNVALHIRKGIIKVFPEADCKIIPMADGGEGTVETLVEVTNGHIENAYVHDPLMRLITAFYGILGDNRTAVIEMAAASGLVLLKPEERNPLITSTYGTGELIRHALDKGCTAIILGIGGSATVDGGVGMAQALGGKFTDNNGQEIGQGGGSLNRIARIDLSGMEPRLSHCVISAACDVTNLLYGPKGAASIYGPQKGASPAMVKQLDSNLKHLAKVIDQSLKKDVKILQGGGAAGGLGAGIVAFLNGELQPGFNLISRIVQLEEWIRWADLVITGEGKMDIQTVFGKTPAGVAKTTKKLKKPALAFTGSMDNELNNFRDLGFISVIPISDKPMTKEQSMADAGRLLENAAERIFRVMKLGKRVLERG